MADVRMTRNRWKTLAAEARAKADDVTETFAGLIEAKAAADAPYQYGALQSSVAVEEGATGTASRRITVGQFYGLYQEKGTHTKSGAQWVPPHPFLGPAAEGYRGAYVAAIAGVVSGGW